MCDRMETNSSPEHWNILYKAAGVAALVSEAAILLGLVMYFFWPYAPGNKSTEQIFVMLQAHPLGGMISLDLFLLLGNLFSLFIFLGLYISLKRLNPSYALMALAVGLLGLVLLIPARPIPELFALSKSYTAATTDADKSQLLAAGTALLALFNGIGWFLNTLLGGLSLLVSSIIMLRSKDFSKAAAWIGIITNAVVCCFFIPVVGKWLLFLSLPGYMVWYILMTRAFFRMGRST